MTGAESNDENIVYKLSYSESEGYQLEETETYGKLTAYKISK